VVNVKKAQIDKLAFTYHVKKQKQGKTKYTFCAQPFQNFSPQNPAQPQVPSGSPLNASVTWPCRKCLRKGFKQTLLLAKVNGKRPVSRTRKS